MSDYAFDFQRDGVVILPSVLSDNKLGKIVNSCEDSISDIVGTRNLLNFDWAISLAEELKVHREISSILGSSSNVIQCNYFSKNADKNWYVTLHRDLSIPVAEEIESDKWSGWNVKEGQLYAQPPRTVLESLVAVRIHFEDNDENNGALQVAKGSHKTDSDSSETIVCRVKAGDALAISPLVLHKSSKLKSGSRRVLHFVFGPHNLPDGASWPSRKSH
ncbi:MAG: phytanoyl-CoA dioxygenase family protein [Arenicella sp.]|nr:phytanoyl-CoA dioxygenase family protein [Arenicella sp.]